MAAMPRAGLLVALLSTTATAQVQAPDPLVLLLRDPSGAPVVGARGLVTTRPIGALPALATVADLPDHGMRSSFVLALPSRETARGTSDARGVMRFASEEGPGGCAASGIVWSDSGLGALVSNLIPGQAQRIELQPMAGLTTATGTEVLRVFARSLASDGLPVTPRVAPGTTVRLPAGSYELWVKGNAGWLWERRTLTPGEQVVLAFDGPAQRLRTTSIVHPAARPDVPLLDRSTTTLRGAAIAAPLLAIGPRVSGPWLLPSEPASEPIVWPAPDATPTIMLWPVPEADGVVSDALFSLRRLATGTWQILGASAQRGSRAKFEPPYTWFELAPPPAGDTWLLYVARGYAPQAKPWTGTDHAVPFQLERGTPLFVLASDDRDLPVVDLAVDYVPNEMEPATVEGHTDGRGVARLGPVLGPGVIRVSDPRFRNETIALDRIPRDGVKVSVALGKELRGTAKWAGGAPANGVVVTLRDATGKLRPTQRTVVSGKDGTFVFPGLPEQLPLVLFASAQRDGRTWSGRLSAALANTEPCELVLRNEDPQLGPGDGK